MARVIVTIRSQCTSNPIISDISIPTLAALKHRQGSSYPSTSEYDVHQWHTYNAPIFCSQLEHFKMCPIKGHYIILTLVMHLTKLQEVYVLLFASLLYPQQQWFCSTPHNDTLLYYMGRSYRYNHSACLRSKYSTKKVTNIERHS